MQEKRGMGRTKIPHRTGAIGRLVALLMPVLLWSCGSVEQTADSESRSSATVLHVAPDIVSPAEEVASIQLYYGADERNLPVLPLDEPGLGSEVPSRQMHLKFDVLDGAYEPLEVEFRHMNRSWQPDRVEMTKVFGTFDRDIIRNYEQSRVTRQPFVHYAYSFPNDQIQFLMSGNYVMSVRRNGSEDPLLQLPFVAVETKSEVRFDINTVLVTGVPRTRNQPIVEIDIGRELVNNLADYSACFLRNARFWAVRCEETPNFYVPPELRFYLDPQASFEPDYNTYYVDLSQLQPGARIRRVDFDQDPFEVDLLPDFEGLGASFSGNPQYGQTLIREASPANAFPGRENEYVDVRFYLVPDSENRDGSPVLLSGSFTGWRLENAVPMNWDGELYTAQRRLKQGRYEYAYIRPGQPVERERDRSVFTAVQQYTALIYFRDPFLAVDRIIGYGRTAAK